MRTLKKTLCVVLCLAMMVGLCAFAASAEFTDAAKINYKEAVDVLTGIGVINGKPDGEGVKFDPQGTLTRAEACKIITYVLGYSDIKGTAEFVDTKGHWAEGPIALCASEGIVNGVGNNKFNPNGTLTGSAWAKMLLCALGYNAEYEGMTGSSWEVGVAKTLKATNLLKGITGLDQTADITRETACQMAFNALFEDTRKFQEGTQIIAGDVSIKNNGTYTTMYGPTLAETVFELDYEIDIIVDVPATSGNKYSSTPTNNYAEDFGANAFGRLFKIYYKDVPTANGYTVYATEDLTKEVTITGTMTAAQVKAAFKAAGITAAYIDGTGYELLQNGVNLGAGVDINVGTDNGAAIGAGTFYVDATGAPVVYAKKLADANVQVVSKVAAYTAPTAKATGSITLIGVDAAGEIGGTYPITLEKIGSETPDVVELYDGIKTGDYVYVTKIVNGVGTMKVEKATVIEAAATSAVSGGKVTIAGKTYTVKAMAYDGTVTAYDLDLIDFDLTAPSAGDVGTTLRNYVLTADGKLLGSYAYTAASNAKDYAQILQVQFKAGNIGDLENPGSTYAKVLLKVLLPDGTIDVYTYTSQKKLTALAGTANGAIDGFYEEVEALANAGTYTDGLSVAPLAALDVIKYAAADKVFSEMQLLTEATTPKDVTGAAITAKTAQVAADVYLTATTPVIYYNSTKGTAKVITGYAKTQSAADGDCFFVTDALGKIVCVFVNQAYVDASTVTTTIAYAPEDILAPSATKYDETLKANLYGYDVYIDGAKTTLWSKSSALNVGTGFVEYTVTDGYLTALSNTITGYTADYGTIGMVDATNAVVNGTQYPVGSVKIITVDYTGIAPVVTAGGALTVGQNAEVLFKTADATKTLVYAAIILT